LVSSASPAPGRRTAPSGPPGHRSAPGPIARALRHRNYSVYLAGNSISLIGTWMQRIAVGWLAWELTHSGGWLGVIAFADLFPAALVGPIAGAMTDRVGEMRLIGRAQVLCMAVALVLFGLTAAGLMTPWLLLFLAALNGLVVGFNQPARLSIVGRLVPREDLPTAVALNSVIFNLARFVGPAIAGFVILHGGVALAFLGNALSFVALLVALALLRLPEAAPAAGPHPGRSLTAEIGQGLAYVLRHAGIGPMLLVLTLLAIGCRPFVELLPGFAGSVFGRGADGLAVLSSAVGLGAMASGLWLARRGETQGLTAVTLLSAGVLPLSLLGFAAMDSLWPAAAMAALAGAAMVLSGAGGQTLVQLAVDPAMRGRVLSLYGLIFRAGPAVGAVLMGAASEAVGLRVPLVAGGLAALALCLWTWLRRHAIIAALEPPPGGDRNASRGSA